ncbi:MAG: hypothetical protein CMJ32_11360 [Phycisphaerae bacterium]|nr:hypothetical protein [Phycisphaerae bacterium]
MQVWLNDRLLPAEEARISPFDRGFLFGDGVYEVVRYFDGVPVGERLHVDRLEASLQQLRITGFDPRSLPRIASTLMEVNDLVDCSMYLQVSRGMTETRSHVPEGALEPTVFATTTQMESLDQLVTPIEATCSTAPDRRWMHGSIKSTSLLGNIIPLLDEVPGGNTEVILARNGLLTEGATSNIFIVDGDVLRTPAIDPRWPILDGVMRRLFLEIAGTLGIDVREEDIPVDSLLNADEAFITSSRRLLSPVTDVDGHAIPGSTEPGSMTGTLFQELKRSIQASIGERRADPIDGTLS